MLREAKRKDLEYKRHATMEFGTYLSAFLIYESLQQVKNRGRVVRGIRRCEDNDLQMKPM